MNTREIKSSLGWGMYDFANSGYYLVYIVYLFPVYLGTVLLRDDPFFEIKWGVAQGFAVALAVALPLYLSRWLQKRNPRRVAIAAMWTSAGSSFLIPILLSMHVHPHILLAGFVIVHGFYLISLTMYDATLTLAAPAGAARARLSGWAWGWGYVGGLVCLGLMELGTQFYTRYSSADFAIGSLFFLVMTSISIWMLRIRLNLNEPKQTTGELPPMQEPRQVVDWYLLLWCLLIVDGIAIFMAYMGLYAIRIVGISEQTITLMLVGLQCVAFPATGVVSSLAGRMPKRVLAACAVGWIVAALLVVFIPTVSSFIAAMFVIACVVGSMQSLLRSIYSDKLAPANAIRGFSAYAVVEKGAAFLGPVIAGILIPFVGYKSVFIAAAVLIGVGTGGLVAMISGTKWPLTSPRLLSETPSPSD